MEGQIAADLLFCGENRNKDLRRLVGAFDEVASALAKLDAGKAPEEPIHRVVLVHAERGLGKTRLALELYRHLTEVDDPGGYWPKANDSTAVMPPAETCSFAATLPFLWWGMQIPDSPNPGNTLFGALDDLLPHLVTMRVAHRRAESGKSIEQELGALALDLGIEAIGAGLEIAGLGVIKRVGEAAWRIGGIAKNSRDAPRDAGAEAQRHAETITEEVLADLDRLLNPAGSYFAHLPAVILVDDAQFADRDLPMAEFLKRLIIKSGQNRWPLLIVLTHWSRQLDDTADASGAPRPRSAVAQMLADPRVRATGKLASKLIEIDLGDPVTDLSPALIQGFPGVRQETVAEVVRKTGGNPRKLEQIMARLAINSRWFEDHDIRADFTAEGRQQVLAMSDLPIDEIVYNRLLETPAEIRRALALASIVGPSFVVDLVDRLAYAKLTTGARAQLEDGERRYRFLKEVERKPRNDIGRFAEPLFHDAARDYRSNARGEFRDWPSDEVLREWLTARLDEIVDRPAADGLTDEDVSHLLSLAVRHLEAQGAPKTGLALAQLVRIENRRGNFEGARDAATRFLSGFAP